MIARELDGAKHDIVALVVLQYPMLAMTVCPTPSNRNAWAGVLWVIQPKSHRAHVADCMTGLPIHRQFSIPIVPEGVLVFVVQAVVEGIYPNPPPDRLIYGFISIDDVGVRHRRRGDQKVGEEEDSQCLEHGWYVEKIGERPANNVSRHTYLNGPFIFIIGTRSYRSSPLASVFPASLPNTGGLTCNETSATEVPRRCP